jgi:hypothetical protein
MIRGLLFALVWVSAVSVVLVSTPAPGTDASRFEQRLRFLHDDVFYWHESMYIMGPDIPWEPDWHWYMKISHDIEEFQAELNRLPNSPCAAEARAAVIQEGPWVSATIGDMPGVERRWKDVMEHLPLSCDEF